MVDGPGLMDSDQMPCPDVRPKGYAQFSVEVHPCPPLACVVWEGKGLKVRPWRPGSLAFLAHFSSRQLQDVSGAINVPVEP